jgi:hypothetical protein
MIIHPSRFGIIGPQFLLACLPYGAVMLSRTGNMIRASPIQIQINR